MKTYKRVFIIIIDSLGIGESEDALLFGDVGCDTLGHVSQSVDTLSIDALVTLGLANIHPLIQYKNPLHKKGYACILAEASVSKDTLSGHWEMMGVPTKTAFRTFTKNGFPKELLDAIEKECGRKVIGNISASGTEILRELGAQSMKENALIVYTSADSVLQIAAHEECVGLDELYRCCTVARSITMKEEWCVGRVIARPFIGHNPDTFARTSNRRDYALMPPSKTDLEILQEHGVHVVGIGKIEDIFSGRGIERALHSTSSVEGMRQTIDVAHSSFEGVCFTNLVDFDAKWGHRRDAQGYAHELEAFDTQLNQLLNTMHDNDLLIISADHGNDPTFHGSDHTREDVPLLLYSPSFVGRGTLDKQDSFGCIGATVLENFRVPRPRESVGVSLLNKCL